MSHSVETCMPLVVEKYLGDTTHLTTLQHGAYLLLLLHYWRRGGALPDNDARLAATAKLSLAEWKKHRAVLAEFFVIGNGVWMQKRAEKELARARKKSEAAAKSANARWEKDADSMRTHSDRTASAMQADMRERCGGDAPPSSIPPDASASERKRGSRRKPKHALPSDWVPKARHSETALECGLDLAEQAQRARNWAGAQDARMADWDHFFDNWLLKAKEMKNGRRDGADQRAVQLAAARESAGHPGNGRAAWDDDEGGAGDDRGGETGLAALAFAHGAGIA